MPKSLPLTRLTLERQLFELDLLSIPPQEMLPTWFVLQENMWENEEIEEAREGASIGPMGGWSQLVGDTPT